VTSTTDDFRTAQLRVRGPDDLIHAVPYLLGFHPAESLVALGLSGGSLVVTMRTDLSELERPAVLPSVLVAMADGGATSVVGIVYTEAGAGPHDPAAMPGRGIADQLTAAAESAGVRLGEVLLVSGGRWWSYLCGLAVCCPPQGRPIAAEGSAVAAAATYAGMVALPDRAALEATLAPDPGRDRLLPLLRAAEGGNTRAILAGRRDTQERAVKRALFAKAREHDDVLIPMLDDDEVVRFGAGLRSARLRDAMWRACDARRIDGRLLWQALARRLPTPFDATPLLLYGWASWRHGNGALARIAAERAVECDPSDEAAQLLLALLSRGVDPRRTPRLRGTRSA
jgi:hypothetical protein